MLPRLPRQLRAVSLSALLAATLIACTSAASSPPGSQSAGSTGVSASAPAPTPSATLGPVITLDELIRDIAARDGERVRVDGFFLASGTEAELCAVVLESYPPQCGGPTVRVTGEVPANVLDGLSKTEEPDLARAVWGWVIVTGAVAASGPDGRPTLSIEQIELHEG